MLIPCWNINLELNLKKLYPNHHGFCAKKWFIPSQTGKRWFLEPKHWASITAMKRSHARGFNNFDEEKPRKGFQQLRWREATQGVSTTSMKRNHARGFNNFDEEKPRKGFQQLGWRETTRGVSTTTIRSDIITNYCTEWSHEWLQQVHAKWKRS